MSFGQITPILRIFDPFGNRLTFQQCHRLDARLSSGRGFWLRSPSGTLPVAVAGKFGTIPQGAAGLALAAAFYGVIGGVIGWVVAAGAAQWKSNDH